MTIELLFGAVIIGWFLGLFLALLRYYGFLRIFIVFFVSFIRGTPLILQLSIVYFVFPTIFNIKMDVIYSGILTFGVNSSVYTSELIRAGIESLPKGQFEAAKSLEISCFRTWKDIILPQVIRNVFPAIVNEAITLLKETALISTIGGMDIMRQSQMLSAQEFSYFMPLTVAALYYYILVVAMEYLGALINKRFLFVGN